MDRILIDYINKLNQAKAFSIVEVPKSVTSTPDFIKIVKPIFKRLKEDEIYPFTHYEGDNVVYVFRPATDEERKINKLD
ncbi:hypothetical protein KKH82_05455 [Patescibacteria group bacterium]|nr:hypothetical protein [Patescibacteria group bacterium]